MIFNALLQSKSVPTMYPIIDMCISNDSINAITVTKKNDHECWIKFYNLES